MKIERGIRICDLKLVIVIVKICIMSRFAHFD